MMGDTVTTNNGISWRLFGIDTPEMSRKNKISNSWANTNGLELWWAKIARDFVAKKILGKKVTIISKYSSTYNRTVGSIYFLDNKHIKNLAFELLKFGLARKGYITTNPWHFNVPLKYYNYVSILERGAIANHKGIWKYGIKKQHIIFPKWNITK